jgi:hypothetical protein
MTLRKKRHSALFSVYTVILLPCCLSLCWQSVVFYCYAECNYADCRGASTFSAKVFRRDIFKKSYDNLTTILRVEVFWLQKAKLKTHKDFIDNTPLTLNDHKKLVKHLENTNQFYGEQRTFRIRTIKTVGVENLSIIKMNVFYHRE